MTTEFKTEIVKTRQYNKTYAVAFAVLYLFSIFYLFLYDRENQNIYLKYLAVIVHFVGIYFLFEQSFIKPKKRGDIKITTEKIEFNADGLTQTIGLNELENIYLKYLDYGSWSTHSIFGNKNYICVTDKSVNNYDFKILIRNRNSKNDLKRILNSPEFYEKFDVIKAGNSRTEF